MATVEIGTGGIEAFKNNSDSATQLQLNMLDIVSETASRVQREARAEESAANETAPLEKAAAADPEKAAVTLPADGAKLAPADRPADADLAAQQAEEARVYPELTLTRQALDALADRSNPRQSWENANVLFHLAEVQVEKYIEYQGGIPKMFQNVNQLAEELYKGIDEFKQGKRGFNVPDYPNKTIDEERLREQIKNFSKKDQLAAIRGEKGPELRLALFNALDTEQKEILGEVDVALNKVELFSSIKLQHALAANKFGVENNDPGSRVLAENILKSIAATDPDTFRTSPEIHGLLLQSERGEPMDLTQGKAIATAMAEEAKKTIVTRVNSVDALFNPEARKEASEQALSYLVAALAANEQTTKSIWSSWSESQNFQALFSAAEAALAAQKQPPSR